jgi:hypothetical protein
MLSVRFIVLLTVMFSVSARADPLQSAISWMAEHRPFEPATIKRLFGSDMEAYCAVEHSKSKCEASAHETQMRWKTNIDTGESEGFVRLQLPGCLSRHEVEVALETPLGVDAHSFSYDAKMLKLTARYWSPGQTWKVGVTFDGRCAALLTISTIPF